MHIVLRVAKLIITSGIILANIYSSYHRKYFILFYIIMVPIYYIHLGTNGFFLHIYLQASSETNDSIELPGSRRSTAGSSGHLLQKHNTILWGGEGEGRGDGWFWLGCGSGATRRGGDTTISVLLWYYDKLLHT